MIILIAYYLVRIEPESNEDKVDAEWEEKPLNG